MTTTRTITILLLAILTVGAMSGCIESVTLPDMQTVTVIDDMGITQSTAITYNVYDMESHRTGTDFFGLPEYTIVLYVMGDVESRYTITYTEVNRVESVPQGRVILHQVL